MFKFLQAISTRNCDQLVDTYTVFVRHMISKTDLSKDSQISLQIWQFVTFLKSFFQSETLCDITFLCDEREIYAHRAVLCANTSYFKCMFNIGMVESVAKLVPIKGSNFIFIIF